MAKVVSYKCSDCGTVASIYKTYAAAKASGLKNVEAFVNDDGETIYLAYTDGKTDTTKPTDTNKSPKTFDAGIAMYVGMALTSVVAPPSSSARKGVLIKLKEKGPLGLSFCV